jgi:hypothetical protein
MILIKIEWSNNIFFKKQTNMKGCITRAFTNIVKKKKKVRILLKNWKLSDI